MNGLFILLLFLLVSSSSLFAGGKVWYEKKCAQCHGVEGKGNGEAAEFVFPKPRDFTMGAYKIRTTPSGVLPTDEDLIRTISQGIPGTSMPGFEKSLSKNELSGVVNYIKTFFPKFKDAERKPVEMGKPPRASKDLIEKGKELFKSYRCFECHGTAGRADGPSSPTLKDEKGDPLPPADLTKPWNFRGGGEVKDIFTRLTTGLSGTPMPSYAGIATDEKEDIEARWALSHYVKHLSQGHPNIKTVIPAELVEGELAAAPDNPIWQKAEEVDIPLVGQVIAEPRLFFPSIDMVTVSAIYNQRETLIRARWNDRTKDSNAPKIGKDTVPDSLTIQFPLQLEAGGELPYFLGGDESRPVQTLTWSPNFDKIVKNICKGTGLSEAVATLAQVQANFDQGQWTLFLRLPLSSNESFAFKGGDFVPVAFAAGNGSKGEFGAKRSISAWVYLLLKKPGSKMRFVWPSLAFIGSLGAEILILKRVRRTKK